MRKLALLILVVILFAPNVFAETITLDTSGWTQEEKNMIKAVAYRLAWEADNNNKPPVVEGNKVIFKETIGDVVTGQKIRDRWADMKIVMTAEAEIEKQRMTLLKMTLRTKLTENHTDEELQEMYPHFFNDDGSWRTQ